MTERGRIEWRNICRDQGNGLEVSLKKTEIFYQPAPQEVFHHPHIIDESELKSVQQFIWEVCMYGQASRTKIWEGLYPSINAFAASVGRALPKSLFVKPSHEREKEDELHMAVSAVLSTCGHLYPRSRYEPTAPKKPSGSVCGLKKLSVSFTGYFLEYLTCLGLGNCVVLIEAGAEGIESSPAKKDLGVLVDERANLPWGCITSSVASRSGEVILPLCSALDAPTVLHPALGPPTQERRGQITADPEDSHKSSQSSCEERLRELGLFNLEERRLPEDLLEVHVAKDSL
ncbi:hypothetical protein WISP_119931 [Willisornis vidua]|uniref:Uncharacterized protein n=1 Tax=Willisornis vidua TaxID=1566151 RepID=A0ABQ9CYE3_9PASS|nr:hypothetical protein WISP_119931 [Willisornis vidua]